MNPEPLSAGAAGRDAGDEPRDGAAASPAVPFTLDADLDLGTCMEPWPGAASGADVTIRRGGVPTALPAPEAGGVVWRHAGRRTLLSPPCGVRFLVEDGARQAGRPQVARRPRRVRAATRRPAANGARPVVPQRLPGRAVDRRAGAPGSGPRRPRAGAGGGDRGPSAHSAVAGRHGPAPARVHVPSPTVRRGHGVVPRRRGASGRGSVGAVTARRPTVRGAACRRPFEEPALSGRSGVFRRPPGFPYSVQTTTLRPFCRRRSPSGAPSPRRRSSPRRSITTRCPSSAPHFAM